MKLTQKEIKRLVKTGAAVDITAWSAEKIEELQNKNIEKVGLSFGVYGMNGGLFKDKNGNSYAITARAGNLFILA
jgi:hypothetical protein